MEVILLVALTLAALAIGVYMGRETPDGRQESMWRSQTLEWVRRRLHY